MSGDLARVWTWVRPYRARLLAGGAVVLVSAALPALTVLLLQYVVDHVLVTPSAGAVVPAALAFLVLPIAEGGLVVARTHFTRGVALAVAHDLRLALFGSFLLQGPGPEDTGERLGMLSDEADEVMYAVPALVGFVRHPLALGGLALTGLWLAPRLLPLAVMVLPLAVLSSRLGGRAVRQSAGLWREARSALLSAAHDPLALSQVVSDHGAEAAEKRRLEGPAAADRDARLSLERLRLAPRVGVRVLSGAALGVLVAWGGAAVAAGQLEPGALVGFVAAIGLAARPAADLSEAWSLWQRASGALERLSVPLQRGETLWSSPGSVSLPHGPLRLELDGVGAEVGGRQLFEDVRLTVEPGEVVALTGPTGAGKSTLLGLIIRAREPSAGRVCLGGVDVRRLDGRELTACTGIVRQEGGLLARTIRENLCLGGPVSDERLCELLALVEASFALSRGLGAALGEGAVELSGGERQRLCLARALVHDPRVLILDEPTNQVDGDTSRAIGAALRRLAPGRVIVVATHDPVLVAAADRVVALQDGCIREAG